MIWSHFHLRPVLTNQRFILMLPSDPLFSPTSRHFGRFSHQNPVWIPCLPPSNLLIFHHPDNARWPIQITDFLGFALNIPWDKFHVCGWTLLVLQLEQTLEAYAVDWVPNLPDVIRLLVWRPINYSRGHSPGISKILYRSTSSHLPVNTQWMKKL